MAQRVGWKRYIWREHKLVSFRSFDPGGIQLLDVVVQQGSHGIPGFGRGPKLVRIGPLFLLGAPPAPAFVDADSDMEDADFDSDSEDECEVDVSMLLWELKEEKKRFERSGGSIAKLRHFTRAYLGECSMKLESSSKMVSHICCLAGVSILGDQGYSCSIKGIQAESVKVDHVAKLFSADPGEAGWLPKTAIIQLLHKKSTCEQLELWVVTKIVYASKIEVGKLGSSSAKVDVSLPVTLGPVPIAGGVEVERKAVNLLEVVAHSGSDLGVPIGYQAIRVKYDKGGAVCVGVRMEMGESLPIQRGAQDDNPVQKELEKHPEYHMGDLMDDTLQSLPVVSLETWQDSSLEAEASCESQT